MAKKLISYDDEAEGLGLPDVVEGKLAGAFADRSDVRPLAAVPHSQPVRTPAKWRDMMRTGHVWGALGAGIGETIPDDATRNWRGDQAFTVISTPTGTSNFTIRRAAIPAFSIAGNVLRVDMKIDRPDLVNQIEIMVGTDYTNFYTWRVAPGKFKPNEPYEAILPPIPFSASGNMARNGDGSPATTEGFTNISVRISPKDSGRNTPITVSLQSVELISSRPDIFPNGCVSVTFDDGWENVHSLAKPVMDYYGIRSTQYLIISSLGSSAYMTLDQVKNLHRDGHEIGLHAYSAAVHSGATGAAYQDVTEQVAREDMVAGREWLIEHNFPAGSFAYPKGNIGLTTDGASIPSIVADYFQTGRTIQSGIETLPPSDPYLVSASTGVGEAGPSASTPDALVSAGGGISRTKSSKGWLVLVFHNIIEGTPTSSEHCSVAGFEQIMSHLEASGVEVLPVGDAMARIISATRTA